MRNQDILYLLFLQANKITKNLGSYKFEVINDTE
ncbi:hypothetical protein MBOVPG45_0704 [Mycoplasmopsis bovis PG45]|uniref:Uncharacterized protein n=1 Tax=Mycoplasmopsis bovis (strain ATCC 25523 / DSM 22781 / NCTC 10131 / PG45) TaxID=289397 RepID=A0A454APV2_MYCBG|nr:hypothetical protein MBOVPG45_0704 [Mycoplasmopsis bovis PG45]